MRQAFLLTAAIGSVCVAGARPAWAQVGYLWSFQERLQKADLVVIAECERTVDTGNVGPHPEVGPPPAPFVRELQTTFRVSAVLKAAHPLPVGAALVVRHYRYTDEVLSRGLINGGSWLGLERQRSYLLFLCVATRGPWGMPGTDGVYEPLSGHTFPTESVFLLDSMSADGTFKEGP